MVIDPRTQRHVDTTIFLITLDRLESWERVGGGGGRVKKGRLGSCVCEWGGRGRWGERRDVGELCVCGGGGGVKEERSFT